MKPIQHSLLPFLQDSSYLTCIIVFADIVQVDQPIPSLQDWQLWHWIKNIGRTQTTIRNDTAGALLYKAMEIPK